MHVSEETNQWQDVPAYLCYAPPHLLPPQKEKIQIYKTSFAVTLSITSTLTLQNWDNITETVFLYFGVQSLTQHHFTYLGKYIGGDPAPCPTSSFISHQKVHPLFLEEFQEYIITHKCFLPRDLQRMLQLQERLFTLMPATAAYSSGTTNSGTCNTALSSAV